MKMNKYTNQTQTYIKDVQGFLVNKYGSFPKEWEAILTLLADNLDLYKECKESIKKNGVYDAESGKKNPLLSTVKDLQATIIKQIQHLGLSPYAISRLGGENQESEVDGLFDELVNG